ncbi:hypothetical protein B0H12DRAFT_402346 [Mycena haematopus]|nr:hypothetical protein B0H12DRAFT_402346 [Mycena haematopus]
MKWGVMLHRGWSQESPWPWSYGTMVAPHLHAISLCVLVEKCDQQHRSLTVARASSRWIHPFGSLRRSFSQRVFTHLLTTIHPASNLYLWRRGSTADGETICGFCNTQPVCRRPTASRARDIGCATPGDNSAEPEIWCRGSAGPAAKQKLNQHPYFGLNSSILVDAKSVLWAQR